MKLQSTKSPIRKTSPKGSARDTARYRTEKSTATNTLHRKNQSGQVGRKDNGNFISVVDLKSPSGEAILPSNGLFQGDAGTTVSSPNIQSKKSPKLTRLSQPNLTMKKTPS